MRRQPVRPFEVDMVRALNAAYMEAARAGQDGQAPPAAVVSSRPMTMELFDTLFWG